MERFFCLHRSLHCQFSLVHCNSKDTHSRSVLRFAWSYESDTAATHRFPRQHWLSSIAGTPHLFPRSTLFPPPPMAVRTVDHLRALLKAHKLSINGRKSILEERCRANAIDMDGPIPSVTAPTAAPPPTQAAPVPDSTSFATRLPLSAPVVAAGTVPAEVQHAVAACSSSLGDPAPNSVPHQAPNDSEPVRVTPTAPTAPNARAPDFTKHEEVRLTHVLSDSEVAAGVMVSRGKMTREQMDAKKLWGEVWLVVVGAMFNSDKKFVVPRECSDLSINQNLHPRARTSQFLKAKLSEVRLF